MTLRRDGDFMGQYYVAYLKNEKENPIAVIPRSISSGIKLMEHSWIGNRFMQAVMNYVCEHGPMHIIWVGDYADSDDNFAKIDEHEEIYSLAWGEKSKLSNIPTISFEEDSSYIINHTKNQYVDLKEYIKKNTDEAGWCAHPLSLLTAAGNGQGGGDYYGSNSDMCGAWMNDLIEVAYEAPKGYEKLSLEFKEDY